MQSKIHQIELYNFKSYNGRITVGPFKDFSCIVGPNGSGKSNLMDALSFVLSRDTKTNTLRGKKASDFIHRKAAKKECEATIVLRRGPAGEATGGATAAASARAKTTDTSFTRRVEGSGEVRTLINGQLVTEKKFFETLEQQHKISSRVNTFLVFQHEVDSVARKKAKELTDLLESVSGSGELKQEYAGKKKALEEANQAMTTASAEKRGAVLAVNQMRLVKKEADKFEEVQRRYLKERHDVAMAELFGVETELERQKEELVKFNANLSELQRSVTTEQELRDMKRAYTELHRKYLEDLKKNRKAADELRGKVHTTERVKAALAHLQRKHEMQAVELESLTKADTVRSAEIKRLEDQLKKQQQLLQAYDRQCEKEDREAAAAEDSLSPETMAEYRRLRKEADCETVTLRQHAETIRRQLAALEESQRQCGAAREAMHQQRAELEQSRARTEAYLRELTQRHRDLAEGKKALEQQIDQTRRELQTSQRKSKEREVELAKLQEQLHELRFVKASDKQHSRMADALQALRSLFPIRGRLVDLCTVPNERYRNAVTAALGRNLDAIVVNSTETAIACVRYLKEQRMPPITFLPLDAVNGPAVDDRLRTLGGTCKPLVDVVRFEAELEPVIRFALGQALVCDALPEAKAAAYGSTSGERFKVVTVDGTTLLKNGSVQGGLASVQSRAKKWDEKRYDDLRAARERLLSDAAGGSEAELARAQIAIRDMEARLEFNKNRSNVVEAERKSNEDKLRGHADEVRRLEAAVAALDEREAALKKETTGTSTELLRAAQAVSKVENQIFADFQKRVNVPDLKQLENRQATLAANRAQHRQQLQLLIHRLEGAVEAETKRIGGQSAADLTEMGARVQREMETCRRNLQAQQSGVLATERTYEQARGAAAKAREQLDKLETKIRQVTRESETMLTRLSYARKGSTGLQIACDTLRQRRLNIVRRCQMEQTEVPFKPDTAVAGAKRARSTEETRRGGRGRTGTAAATGEDTVPAIQYSEPFALASSTGGSGQPGSPTAAAAAAEAKVCIDFTGLTDALQQIAAERSRFVAYRQRADALIEGLSAEMEALVPNIKAVTRFASSEDRLGTSSTVLDEARERSRKAHAEFQQIKELRSARFMEVYDKVAANVDRVYQELTLGTRAHAVHGSAYLSLEDVEEPYLGGTTYHATPPLKRFMPMELLSGGERTMAALALLFAIHAVSPSPFFVLDEVDAALDAGNVEKLANYLRTNSKACQFIVVSLKDQLYHLADILIGVMKDKERESSKVLTMDLNSYAF